MSEKLSKADASAFRERWRLVNVREAEELRSASPDLRWKQFLTLLAWAREFGWNDSLAEGEAEVRERWARLRKAHLAETTRPTPCKRGKRK